MILFPDLLQFFVYYPYIRRCISNLKKKTLSLPTVPCEAVMNLNRSSYYRALKPYSWRSIILWLGNRNAIRYASKRAGEHSYLPIYLQSVD
jgi:hypothetical protein